jgi:hypothetical protein
MKSDTKKLLIQVISVLLFSIIVMYFLPPKGGGNMGEIFFHFIKRHLLICVVGLLVSDVIIFMRRPKFIAAIVALVAGFVGAFIGSMLGILFAALIESLIGIYSTRLIDICSFVGPIICMVFSYNFVAKRVRW